MKKIVYAISALILGMAILMPEAAFAASGAFAGSSLSEVITGFFGIPLVKGIIMTGTIGGGLYLVLAGFGILGKGNETDIKKIIFGGILTGIGLSYDALVTKIANQFQ